MKPTNKKVCVIGAGCSGISVMKELQDVNIPFDCYESGSTFGGLWRDVHETPMYAYCRIHIRKELMAFPDFPMPKEYPVYLNHVQYYEYLSRFVKKHNIEKNIQFNTTVIKTTPKKNGSWDITLDNGKTINYDVIIVANGHYWKEKLPDFPGAFNGISMHSKHYETPEKFKDKNVLVVGIGNTGVDIAVDLSRVTKNTYLSTRGGAHIAPRYILGKPAFDFYKPFISKLPVALQRRYVHFIMWLGRGKLESYGLPKPNHKLFTKSLSMSSELFDKLLTKEIKIKPNVKVLHSNQVEFEDGTIEDIDIIIYATGYKPHFPFFEESGITLDSIIGWNYLHVINLKHLNLYFVGLVKPFGPNLPAMIIQAKWIAAILSDRIKIPDRKKMLRETTQQNKNLKQFYPSTDINRLRINMANYIKSIRREMKS